MVIKVIIYIFNVIDVYKNLQNFNVNFLFTRIKNTVLF